MTRNVIQRISDTLLVRFDKLIQFSIQLPPLFQLSSREHEIPLISTDSDKNRMYTSNCKTLCTYTHFERQFEKKTPIHRSTKRWKTREEETETREEKIETKFRSCSNRHRRIATRIGDRRARENHFHDSRLCHGLDMFQCWFRDLEPFQSCCPHEFTEFREFRRSTRVADYALTGFRETQVSAAVRNRLNRNQTKHPSCFSQPAGRWPSPI